MPLTFTILPQQVRLGTFIGAGAVLKQIGLANADGTVAINPDTGQPYHQFQLSGTMNALDAAVVGNFCRIAMEVSWDNGATWQVYLSNDWTGGSGRGGSVVLPGFSGALPLQNGLLPDRVRGTFDTLTSPLPGLNTGMTATFS